MTTVTIVGAGFMGSALSWPLADNGHAVRLVGTPLDREIITSCLQERRHPKLRRRLPDAVQPFQVEDLDRALDGAEVVIQGVSSPGIEWFATTVGPRLTPGRPLLSITKGLALGKDGLPCILPEHLDRLLPPERQGRIPWTAVGGPCIAGELAGRRQTFVVYTGRDPDLLERLAGLLRTDYYHIRTSTDAVGVETCVALKNAYTLGIALAMGLLDAAGGPDEAGAVMHNLEAALFAQAGSEMARLIQAVGGDVRAVLGLPGIGDLFVTVQGGRSVHLGRLLGAGVSLKEALARLEGLTLESAEIIRVMSRALPGLESHGLIGTGDLPLLRHLAEVVVQGRRLDLPLERFHSSLKPL